MLCNYLSSWWEMGPDNMEPEAECCTTLTSEHLSIILGNILKILNNNLGIDDAPWMKRIAGGQHAHARTHMHKHTHRQTHTRPG